MIKLRDVFDSELFGYTEEKDSVGANTPKMKYELKSIFSDKKHFNEFLKEAEAIRIGNKQKSI